MKKYILLSLLFCLLLGNTAYSQINELPRSTPEQEGVPSAIVSALLDSLFNIPQTDIHSVMMLRHGKVIAEVYPEPFKAEYQHTLYSCSKTFVSTAVGLAVDANLLRVTDRVATFFPNKLPTEVSPELASMTIHDLLIMASGIDPDGNLRANNTYWIKPLLAKPVKTPGKQFKYDSLCTYLLSAIVQQVTGKTVLAYLQEKIFADLHINKVSWEESPEGVTTGGWGLYLQPESLAKMGQLLLQKGQWNGKQLISETWVSQMMHTHIDTGDGRGYGYQMWEASKDGAYASLQKKLQAYSYPTASGKAKSNVANRLAGKTFQLEDNQFGWKDISFKQGDKQMTIIITDQQGKRAELSAGFKHWDTVWTASRPPYSMNAQQKFKGIEGDFAVAASYGWPSSNILRLNLQYVNWISALDLTITFIGDNIQVTVHKNYEPDVPQFSGTIQ